MAGVNKVILVGRLAKKPELRRTPGGAACTDFSIATSESFTDKSGQKREETEWHNIVCWNKIAELACQYLNKGSNVFIDGKLKTRSWDDQNGQKKYKTEIIANSLQFLDAPKQQNNGGGYQQQPQQPMQPGYQQPQVHPENQTYTVAPQAPQNSMPIDEGLDLPF